MSLGTRAIVALLGPITDDGSFAAFRTSPTRPAPHYILVIAAGTGSDDVRPADAAPEFSLTFASGVNVRAATACHDRLHPEHGDPGFQAIARRLASGDIAGAAASSTECDFAATGFGLTVGGPDPAASADTRRAAYIDVDLDGAPGPAMSGAIPLAGRPLPADGYYGITLEDPDAPWAVSVRIEPAAIAEQRLAEAPYEAAAAPTRERAANRRRARAG